MQLMAATNNAMSGRAQVQGHSHHPSLSNLPLHHDFNFGGMSSALGHRGINHGLPKLDTHGFSNVDFGGGLRTAPALASYPSGDFPDFDGFLFTAGSGSSTINPNALHYNDSPPPMVLDGTSPYLRAFPDMHSAPQFNENFEWMTTFDTQMLLDSSNENAMDGSSPSAISTASQSGISEVMLDGSNNPVTTTGPMWQPSVMAAPPLVTPNPFTIDLGNTGFPEYMNGAPLSPHSIPQKGSEQYFSTPPSMNPVSPGAMPDMPSQGLNQAMHFRSRTPMSMNGLPNCGSLASTVTDDTRQTLVHALAQCAPLVGRKLSLSSMATPMSPRCTTGNNSIQQVSQSLPSTQDLKRYIDAYVRFFHPHLPFLHIPTLSFDVSKHSQPGVSGGRGCLVLSMAAIGALYEMDHVQSKELFDSAKKMIQLYLENRRKEDVKKADFRRARGVDSMKGTESISHTPVWLVQSMMLNVVYGHNCGDKTAGDIASTHCAALVSLARAADLVKPTDSDAYSQDVHMSDGPGFDYQNGVFGEQTQWLRWKLNEERKRTLYAVFIMSSLLVSAYNHAPALTNSEILLDLPCDEQFWTAESAADFYALGGVQGAELNRISFYDALGELLATSTKQQQQAEVSQNQPFGSSMDPRDLPHSNLRPSTFGCLVLINALHNYIWETRQRHHSRLWTNEETERMHRHIEPALKAWQAAWASNPQHSLERPNPYGAGPLSADSIPLLDLAYVRLFVNLARSKEMFWQRDYEGMAEELSRGSQIVQHADNPPTSADHISDTASNLTIPPFPAKPADTSSPGFAASKYAPSAAQLAHAGSMIKRERHLRKAAFYAADSLSMADKLGVTFADFTSKELPLQSAMCAFDCAQILAEWIATVQERVGQDLGILGKDDIDFTQVPGIMLLEEEDCKLLLKIQDLIQRNQAKMAYEVSAMDNFNALSSVSRFPVVDACGYGSKILRLTANMLDKAAVWPGMLYRLPLLQQNARAYT